MTEEQWRSVWEIYQSGSSLPPDQLQSFLKNATDDPQVQGEVLAMFDRNKKVDTLDRAGQRVGRYVLTERLGEGGMGEVYAARDSELGRSVAVKLLAPPSAGMGSPPNHFIREARAASALNHPNIVTIYEVIHATSRLAIVMELVEGVSLRQLCGSPLPVDQVLHIGEQIARAMAAAHARGIVHCDIKPENLMLRPDGFVKVMDFGLARDLASVTSKSTMPAGTLRYMSPEQSRGEAPSPACDVFSMGIVLYELATGAHPFERGSIFETLQALNQSEPPVPSSQNPFVPAHLDALILRMLAKEPRQRPAASEVAKVLELRGASPQFSGESAAAHKSGSLLPPLRRRWAMPALAVAAVITLGWSAFLLWNRGGKFLSPLEAVPLATEFGVKRDTTFSPDGKRLAYVLGSVGGRDSKIYIQPLNGGAAVQLTSPGQAADYNPTWSPDGKTIAFLRYIGVLRSEVITIPAVGGAEHKVADLRTPQLIAWGVGPFLRWSPDPRWLVISHNPSAGDAFGLFLLSVETGELRRLTTASTLKKPFGDGAPAFSPDGRTLAFSRVFAEGSSDLYVLPLSKELQPEGEPRRLPTTQPWNSQPAWTPDGREIVFCTGTLDSVRLSRISPSSAAEPQVLAGVGESGWYPAIAPGRDASLVYTRQFLTNAVWRLPLDHDATGPLPVKAAPLRVIDPAIGNATPAWSPDNQHFAFVSARTGASEIWVANSDGSNIVQWTHLHPAHLSSPRWSADGRKILFRVVVNGRRDIYAVDGPGLEPHPVHTTAVDNAVWSPDGKWIYLSNEQGQFWRAPASGGIAVPMAEEGGYNLRISPDGRTIYYAKVHVGQVWIWGLPIDDASTDTISSPFPKPVLAMSDSYSVGKRGLYFVPLPSVREIDYFDLASRKTRRLIQLDKEIGYQISISPDERYLLYEQMDSQVVEVMKVDRFR